jgi:hypothetical protein
VKIATKDLIGPALDWVVAKCEGHVRAFDEGDEISGLSMKQWNWVPTENWSQGGPIIEREEINLEIHEGGHTRASFYRMRLTHDGRVKHYHHQHGPTPLIAAMRCFVSSRLGDEVDVPDELIGVSA